MSNADNSLDAEFLAGHPIAPGDGAVHQIVYWNTVDGEKQRDPSLVRYQTRNAVMWKLAHHPLATDAESLLFCVGDDEFYAILTAMRTAVGAQISRERAMREIANQGKSRGTT